jgi:hypothetical protein
MGWTSYLRKKRVSWLVAGDVVALPPPQASDWSDLISALSHRIYHIFSPSRTKTTNLSPRWPAGLLTFLSI